MLVIDEYLATVLDRYGHLLPGHEEAVDDAFDAMVQASRTGRAAIVRAMDAR